MKKLNIKIRFDTNQGFMANTNVLLWYNYEEKIRSDINKGKGGSYSVFIKHPMPRKDMDKVILELCDRLVWDGRAPISYGEIEREYTFSGEALSEEIITNACYQFVV